MKCDGNSPHVHAPPGAPQTHLPGPCAGVATWPDISVISELRFGELGNLPPTVIVASPCKLAKFVRGRLIGQAPAMFGACVRSNAARKSSRSSIGGSGPSRGVKCARAARI